MLQRVPLLARCLPPSPSPAHLLSTTARPAYGTLSSSLAITADHKLLEPLTSAEATDHQLLQTLSHGSSPSVAGKSSSPISTAGSISTSSVSTSTSSTSTAATPISQSSTSTATPSRISLSSSPSSSSSSASPSSTSLMATTTPTSISTSTTSSTATPPPISPAPTPSSTSPSTTTLPVAVTETWTSPSPSPSSPSPSSTSSLSPDTDGFLFNSSFLSCCEPGERLNVGVLLSGGVDSSVALRLLLAAGHSCTAFYLKIWFQEDFENFWSSCPWDEDLKFAQAVCDEAGVELQVVQMTDEYWKNVVSYMIAEYQAGRTPNPDVLCNSRIKFGVFLEHVKNMGFDRVASGHYAKVVRMKTGSEGTQAVLQLSKDEVKDQTYFLSHLSQFQLSQLMFPLGCVSKGEVRQIADWLGLPNKQRKDSQGICFLGKVKFSDFICRHLGEREGKILEAETGTYLGSHKGFWFYTIGQRQGLRLSHGPWYVVDKDQENNVIFVSKEYFSVEKKRRMFEVHAFNWFGGQLPKDLSGLKCKVRHGPRFYECSISFNDNPAFEVKCTNPTSALVQLSEDDQGIAAGQYAAFYRGDVCLGSGVISGFKADGSSAVSIEARKAAKMELPVTKQSKSKTKKISSLHARSITEKGPEDGGTSMPQTTFGWFLPRLQRWVKECFSWIQSR